MTVPDALLLCAAGSALLLFAQRLRRAQFVPQRPTPSADRSDVHPA